MSGEKVFERVFELEKVTKNTYRFREMTEGQPPVIGTLYVQKWAVGSNPPKEIRVKLVLP